MTDQMIEILDSYCGHSFWDQDLVWNVTSPVFTPCFSATVLTWIPCLWIWIAGLIAILVYKNQLISPLPWTWINITKTFLIGLIILVNGIEFVERLIVLLGSGTIDHYEYQTPFIKLVTFIFVFTLSMFYKRRGVHTSAILFFFWIVMSAQSVLSYWTIVATIRNPYDKYWSVERITLACQSIEVCAVILSFLLSCFSDQQKDKFVEDPMKICPYERASFFSQLTFAWYDSMAWLGYKKALTMADMWNLPVWIRSRTIFSNFRGYLASSEVQKKLKSDEKMKQLTPYETVSLAPRVNILVSLLLGFWAPLSAAMALKFASSFLTFANPSLLDRLLSFVASDQPAWQGYIVAVAMFLFSQIQSLVDGQYEFWIQTTGVRMRASMIATIYQKSLRLSNDGRKAFTTGEIVNLMGVDTNRVVMFINSYNFLLSFPVQLSMSLWLLWQQIGVAAVGGLIFMVLLIPFNGWVAMKMKQIQARVMKQKDARTKIMNEVLSGMKVLKLYAWENAFCDIVKDIRAKEIKALKTQAIFSACTNFAFFSAPFFVALISFSTFVLIDPNNVLNANKAFVSLSLFNILSNTLTILPRVITQSANCWVSIKRMNKYLRGNEIDESQISHEPNKETPVSMESASFAWSASESPVLSDMNMKIKSGSLVAIVGTIGSGKSSLLSALLGDLHKFNGKVNVHGKLAYVPQTAWIQNVTLRRNITFAQSYIQDKYDKVIEACALAPDLKILPAGDETEIGERGINLSGGQKQRVSLARSVYADADLYLLDDPLSAVDAHVAKHLFQNVIGPKGLLAGKTRLLVTHRITFLPQVDEIIVMKDGKIQEQGTYAELIAKKGEFADFIVQYLTEANEVGDDLDEDIDALEQLKQVVKPELEKRLSQSEASDDLSKSRRTPSTRLSRKSFQDEERNKKEEDKSFVKGKRPEAEHEKHSKGELIAKEKAATGSVKGRIYLEYFKAIGYGMCLLIILTYGAVQGLSMSRSLWLTAWSDDSLDSSNLNDTHLRNIRLGVYAGIGGLETVFNMLSSLTLNIAVLHGSKLIHDRMIERVIKAPMSFFDTTPLGRVLNRFSGDIDTCDSTIGFNLRALISLVFRGIVSLSIVCLETPYFLIVIIVMSSFYGLIQKFYIASSRQLRRIDSTSKSPIYSHFAETVSGTSTIRAYNANEKFIEECFNRVDRNHSCSFPNLAAGRWLSTRLQFLGNIIIFAAAVFAVASRYKVSPGLTGLFVSYASQITGILNMAVRAVTDIETNIVAVERCVEYTRTPTEADWVNEKVRPSSSWPNKGEVIFRNYQTRYRPELDPVLSDISFSIKPNEKIGIVGRTGAGKSSLTLAVFRIIEAVSGQIIIDGMDISQLGLHDLRSRLTVIPQDPVLFSGNFRRNFDPLDRHSDQEIWFALEQAHLKKFISTLEAGLNYQISEGGENLSVGQRQLVCLTRALLRKSKILVLDEATAAVDVETDELIQKTIRSEFSDCTIITIAHRLNTIMDYDRILVLDHGQIKEFDSPAALLANTESIFYSMAKESKLV